MDAVLTKCYPTCAKAEELLSLRHRLVEAEAASAKATQELALNKARTKQLIAAWEIRLEENRQDTHNFRQQKDTEMKAITSSLLLFEGHLRREQKQISHLLSSKDKCIRQQRDTIKQLRKENDGLKAILESEQCGLDIDHKMHSYDDNRMTGSQFRCIHRKSRSKSSIEFGLRDPDGIINGQDRTLALRAGRKKMFRSKSLVENRLPQVSEEYEAESCDKSPEIERKSGVNNENVNNIRPLNTSHLGKARLDKRICTQKLVRQEYHIDESDEMYSDADATNLSRDTTTNCHNISSGAISTQEWLGNSCSSGTNSTFTSPRSSISEEFDLTESSEENFDIPDNGSKIPQIQSVIEQIEKIDMSDRKAYEDEMPKEMWINANLERNPTLSLFYQEDMIRYNTYKTPKDVKRKQKNRVRTGSLPTLSRRDKSDSAELEHNCDSDDICQEDLDEKYDRASELFSLV